MLAIMREDSYERGMVIQSILEVMGEDSYGRGMVMDIFIIPINIVLLLFLRRIISRDSSTGHWVNHFIPIMFRYFSIYHDI